MELTGKVVIVPVDWPGAAGLATRMSAAGATVVMVGPDGDAAGQLAATLEAGGARPPGGGGGPPRPPGGPPRAAGGGQRFRPAEKGAPGD